MNFIDFYQEKTKQIINNIALKNVIDKKKELLESIHSKNINAPSIKEVKNIINKTNMDFTLENVIPKILEEDNIFASFFYGKPQITNSIGKEIIKQYLEKFNITFKDSSPTSNLKKYSFCYLGNYKQKEVYFYLIDKNKSSSHNEVLQRVKILGEDIEYKNHLVIFDDVINGDEISKNFPELYSKPNILNIKTFINA